MSEAITEQKPLRVWITGVRRGLGRAVAIARAQNGDKVAGCSRNSEGLTELAKDLSDAGAPAVYLDNADITNRQQLDDWCAHARLQVGEPDVVIHNAAVLGPRAPLERISHQDWQNVLDVNATGTFHVLQTTAQMAEPTRPSLWIWVTSSVGARGRAEWGPYAASNATLENLHETFADENDTRPWTSVALNPGATRTDMRAEAYPDEDPETLPDAATIAGAFSTLIERWQAGQLQTGSRHNARELLKLS